ncbi:hypothetical protein ACFL0X_01530, partial [Nanoarchaeota archaeon]
FYILVLFIKDIMKKGVIVLLLFGMLLVSPLVQAQEQAQTYSSFNRFVDNVKMFFSSGDNEVRLALEIREKEVNSAIVNSQNRNEKDAIKNLEQAHKRLQFINGKVSLDVTEEVKESVDEVVEKIEGEEELSDNFDVYVLEEKKTQLTAELTEKTYEYCKELAKEDFALMLKDKECNPETASEPIKEDLEKLIDLQERMFVQLMLEIRSCMDDPGTCNCEANVDVNQKLKCEKMVALALKCEYQDDEVACDELNSLGTLKAESFVPEFLRNLFRAKEKQMLWGEKPSDCVPEECWDNNDKPECKQYDKFKETKEDWDEYGNFIGTRDKCGKEGSTPTMKESIPQCFDGDIFLEEKCGEITMIENEEGLINYIIENELNGILGGFENKSKWYAPGTSANGTKDINGSLGQAVLEIKKEINNLDKDVEGWVVDHPVNDKEDDDGFTWEIKTEMGKDGEGTGGLTPEIKNEMGVGNDGDDGLTPEVKTDMAFGGHEEDNDVVTDSGNGGMAEGTSGGAPSDTIEEDDWVEKNEIFEGTGGEGSTVDS